MKKQRLITTIITSGFILLLCITAFLKISAMKNLTNADFILTSILLGVLGVLNFFPFFKSVVELFSIFFYEFENYRRKHSYLRAIQKIQILPEEFCEVKIKNFECSPLADFFNEESMSCKARLDENGEVIFKIRVNATMSTDDYVWFLQNFSISQTQNE